MTLSRLSFTNTYLLFQVCVAPQHQQHVMIDSSVLVQLHFASLTLQDTWCQVINTETS